MYKELKKTKIILSSFTPYHMYGLAKYLDEMNLLKILVTNYPYFTIKKYGIKKSKIISYISTGVLLNIFRKTPLYHIRLVRKVLSKPMIEYFSEQVKNYVCNLKENEKIIYWGLSGCSLETLKTVKKRSCVKILDFGSINLEYQKKLMTMHSINNYVKSIDINTWMIDRQNKEINLSDIVLVSSKFSKKSFKMMGFNTNKFLIKHPNLDLKIFKLKKNIKKLPNYTFLYVGNLGFNKGVESLCEAFNLEFENKLANLYLIGGSVDRDYTKFLKNKFSNENIHFLGVTSKKKLVDYYNSADCTILPSIADGFGKTILESLSCGTPAICSKNVGALDILSKDLYNLSWEPLDIDNIRKSLNFMYAKREYYIDNRNKLAKEFSIKNYNLRIKKEYELIFKKINDNLKVKK